MSDMQELKQQVVAAVDELDRMANAATDSKAAALQRVAELEKELSTAQAEVARLKDGMRALVGA